MLAVGLAHLFKEVRFNGTLEAVVGTTHNLHLNVEFVKKALVESDLRGHAVQVEGTFGVEDDLVGNGGHVIGTLRVVLSVGDNELA